MDIPVWQRLVVCVKLGCFEKWGPVIPASTFISYKGERRHQFDKMAFDIETQKMAEIKLGNWGKKFYISGVI